MTTVRFDFAPAHGAADRLESLARGALLRLSAVDAANEVVTRFDKQARRDMNAGLNLTDDYISSRVKVTRATAAGNGPVRADIVTRGDLTILGHYPVAQLRIPGTQLRQGPSRGRRPSGVAVEIKRGQAEIEPQWFLMRLKNSGKTGAFVRTTASGGKPVHKYGPSPYSLFRYQVNTHLEDINADLERTATRNAADAVRKALL